MVSSQDPCVWSHLQSSLGVGTWASLRAVTLPTTACPSGSQRFMSILCAKSFTLSQPLRKSQTTTASCQHPISHPDLMIALRYEWDSGYNPHWDKIPFHPWPSETRKRNICFSNVMVGQEKDTVVGIPVQKRRKWELKKESSVPRTYRSTLGFKDSG